MVILVMGVCGCGKTVVGSLLAGRLGLPFIDADDFHTEHNIRKMHNGIPLEDIDREGWLRRIAARIKEEDGVVVACSALKKKYREMLSRDVRGGFQIVFLKGDAGLIRERVLLRKGHFFNEKLIENQFKTLEEPEEALSISIKKPLPEIVEEITRFLGKTARRKDVVPEDK